MPPATPDFSPLPVLNAGIAGDTVEAILYRVEVMDIPSSVTHISLLCGTNNLCSHSPATISSTITEILIYYDLSVQLHITIYFQFYHDSINFKNTLLLLTLLFIFRFKNCFQNLFFPRTANNPNLYRADKLHLTTKGNDILVSCFHHCITTSNPTNPEPNTSPMPSLQDVPSPLVITDTDWPLLPAPSQPFKPTMPSPYRYSKQSLTTPACTPTATPTPTSPKPISVPSPTKSVCKVFPM